MSQLRRADQRSSRGCNGWGREGAVDFILSLLMRTSAAPLAFAANVVLARLLGPDKYGEYITVLSAALVAGGFAAFGVKPVVTREIARQEPKLRRVTTLAVGGWALRACAGLSLAVVPLLIAWLTWGAGVSWSGWSERVAASILVPGWAFLTIGLGVLNGYSRVVQSQAIGTAWKNLWLLVGAVVLTSIGSHDAADALWLQVATYAIALAFGAYLVSRELDLKRRVSSTVTATVLSDRAVGHRRWLSAAGTFFIMSVATLLLVRLDVVIIAAVSGERQAGLFGAAARLAQIAQVPGMVWLVWLQPRLAYHAERRHVAVIAHRIRTGVLGAGFMTAAVVAAAWVVAPWLMSILGKGFSGSVVPFRWLLVGNLAWAISVPYLAYLTMSNRERLVASILWLQVFMAVGAAVPLAGRLGAVGGSWAWAGSLVAASVLIMNRAIRVLRRSGLDVGRVAQ